MDTKNRFNRSDASKLTQLELVRTSAQTLQDTEALVSINAVTRILRNKLPGVESATDGTVIETKHSSRDFTTSPTDTLNIQSQSNSTASIPRMPSLSCLDKISNSGIPEHICALFCRGRSIEERLILFKEITFLCSQIKNHQGTEDLPRYHKFVSFGYGISDLIKSNGGEDAFFISQRFVGVADGVGEWSSLGFSARDFAVNLMNEAKHASDATKFESTDLQPSLTCAAILKSAYDSVIAAKGNFGSSTALIVGLNNEGNRLGIASIGDSVCMVLRRNYPNATQMAIIRRTREQQHYFNCPFQLSKLPTLEELTEIEADAAKPLLQVLSSNSHPILLDTVECAALYDVPVQKGDLIVVGTDGLFDNMFDQELVWLLSLTTSPHDLERLRMLETTAMTAQMAAIYNRCEQTLLAHKFASVWHIARSLVKAAFLKSNDLCARTPFSKKYGMGVHSRGGKPDDITAVVCRIE